MITTHEAASAQPWPRAELDSELALVVRDRLSKVPHLTVCLTELAQGLGIGQSRTYFCIPTIDKGVNGTDGAMVGAARELAEIVWNENVEAIDPARLEEGDPIVPVGAKTFIDPNSPIGYACVSVNETGIRATVGAFDPQTNKHYSLPL